MYPERCRGPHLHPGGGRVTHVVGERVRDGSSAPSRITLQALSSGVRPCMFVPPTHVW